MYSLDEFGEMVGDTLRFPAYREAIARAVKPGDSVVDIGSGPGGFALLAWQAGAKKANAIDTESLVEFGLQLVATNGQTAHLRLLRWDSRLIIRPERATL